MKNKNWIKHELQMLLNPNTLCPKMYSFDEVREILNEYQKLLSQGRVCTNCGRYKENNLSDWCIDCIENE